MYKISMALFLSAMSHTACAGMVYYLDIVNTAASSIVSFGVARPGSGRFHSILIDAKPLPGGGASATVAIRKGEDEGCVRDLRIGFADGRVFTHHGFNICKGVPSYTDRYRTVNDALPVLVKP